MLNNKMFNTINLEITNWNFFNFDTALFIACLAFFQISSFRVFYPFSNVMTSCFILFIPVKSRARTSPTFSWPLHLLPEKLACDRKSSSLEKKRRIRLTAKFGNIFEASLNSFNFESRIWCASSSRFSRCCYSGGCCCCWVGVWGLNGGCGMKIRYVILSEILVDSRWFIMIKWNFVEAS